ncbi:MAG TPA: HYR domain-containing protein, partial [Bacilli bacterium]|nr:HYR domain-containing protein [Bacilli bacterium]
TVIVINYTEPYGTSSEVVSSKDTKNVGTYLITYTVQDIYGNTSTVTRRLIVDQWLNEIPNIKIDEYMNGSSIGFWNDEIEINSSMPTFTARAYDYFDDKIMHYAEINQSKITIDTTALNIAKKGTYKVTFTAVDWAGNVKTVTEKIKVVDTTKPVITLDTNNLVSTNVNGVYLTIPTASVTDNSGEKLTVNVSKYNTERHKGHVYITSVPYTAKDSSGNKAEYTYTLPTRYQLY